MEVNSSYYAIPFRSNAQFWAHRTPEDFVFNVKAFRLFTGHQTAPAALHRDIQRALGCELADVLYYRDVPAEIRHELWRRFSEALEPLRQAGKLGAVHFQFAPWVRRNRDGHAHVRECVEHMEGLQLAVEFRDKSWFDGPNAAGTLAFQRELGVAHTIVDNPPDCANSVPCTWEVTHPDLALVRLHGRNQDGWNNRRTASSGRFDYRYASEELAALKPRIEAIARQVRRVHVLFNTNNEDQGQVNARLMRQVLT